MTIASNVKQCMVTLKSAKETLSQLALKSSDDEAKRTFHESMMEVEEIISDLKKRIGQLEFEEPQYKGN
jgi:exonuclease VII small subunit